MNMNITQQIEPTRRTFLDVLRENLKYANKLTYVHRLIYVGEHRFSEDPGNTIGDCMEKTIQYVNEGYHEGYLSGLLVCYPKYFCHVLEGSEDSISKHLLFLTANEDTRRHLGAMKMLVCYHHINQRFQQGWLAITGKPPTLLEKIDLNIDLYRTSRHVYNCVQKLYKLAQLQKPKVSVLDSFQSEDTKTSTVSTTSTDIRSATPEQTRTNVSFLIEKYPDCLPEYGLLDFLIATPYTRTLQHYIDVYGRIPALEFYKDKVWPVPCDFVPFNIFDKPFDPVTDLPTAKLDEGTDLLEVE